MPAQRFRENLRAVLPALERPPPPLVSASKGLETETERRMSEVIREELAAAATSAPVAAISGPNIAREVALAQPATTVVAGDDAALTARLRDMLMSPTFRVYTNPDLVGVELGGALKNVVAIGVGIGDALNVGANARAAFLTRGLTEMARLGVALGASPLTFAGLACLGDLIATAVSPHSRNRYVGEQLGRGQTLAEILGRHGPCGGRDRNDPGGAPPRPSRRRRHAHRRRDLSGPFRRRAPQRRHSWTHDSPRSG